MERASELIGALFVMVFSYFLRLLHKRVDESQDSIKKLEGITNTMAVSIASLSEQHEACRRNTDERFKRGRERFSAIEAETKKIIYEIHDAITGIAESMASINTTLEHYSDRIKGIEHKLDGMNR